jgi:hypothetical protein
MTASVLSEFQLVFELSAKGSNGNTVDKNNVTA